MIESFTECALETLTFKKLKTWLGKSEGGKRINYARCMLRFLVARDCFLVYTGGNSCIGFEKLREGIADYEKIRIPR